MFYRFMSFKEFSMMSNYLTIKGHHFGANRTTSDGVCFVEAKDDNEVQWQYQHLHGIVSADVVVGFIPAEGIKLTESIGVYLNQYDELEAFPEVCIPEYDREMMIPVCYSTDTSWLSNKWKWWEFH